MENRELEFKEAVLVAVKVLAAVCFPQVRSQSSVMAGELDMALQSMHHLVALERTPVLPEKPTSATSSGEESMESRLGRQALSALVKAGYVYCQTLDCMNPATHLSDGLPFCERHKGDVSPVLDDYLGFTSPILRQAIKS